MKTRHVRLIVAFGLLLGLGAAVFFVWMFPEPTPTANIHTNYDLVDESMIPQMSGEEVVRRLSLGYLGLIRIGEINGDLPVGTFESMTRPEGDGAVEWEQARTLVIDFDPEDSEFWIVRAEFWAREGVVLEDLRAYVE